MRATGSVMTVQGPIAPEDLGFTLMHEHVYVRLWEPPGRFDYSGLPNDDELMAAELAAYRDRGGVSLVDLTLPAIGRDPERLRAMSDRLGLQIVMGCGWYRQAYYPARDEIDRRTVDDLTRELVDEITTGVGGTEIRPGIIGEIGVDKAWISAQEERVHRAAAQAALETGLTISLHAVACDVGLAQLSLLQSMGVDPERIVVGHADTYRVADYHYGIVELGATLAFDTLRFETPVLPQLADRVVDLIGRGHLERIVLSHDVCWADHLDALGGNGYTFVHDRFVPLLIERGVTSDQLEQLFVGNPRRLLTIGGK